MKAIKRNWLKKQIELGKVEAKCNFHMTDDYAFDNANNFGKTNWIPARISHPTFATATLQNGIVTSYCNNPDFIEGQMNFHEHDFTGKSGGAYYQEDGTIHFYIHSNASYDLRIK